MILFSITPNGLLLSPVYLTPFINYCLASLFFGVYKKFVWICTIIATWINVHSLQSLVSKFNSSHLSMSCEKTYWCQKIYLNQHKWYAAFLPTNFTIQCFFYWVRIENTIYITWLWHMPTLIIPWERIVFITFCIYFGGSRCSSVYCLVYWCLQSLGYESLCKELWFRGVTEINVTWKQIECDRFGIVYDA